MKTLREFIEHNPLGDADAEVKLQDGWTFFSDFLPSSANVIWFRVLSKFTKDIPLRYWDKETIEKALSVLELDSHRTTEGLREWKNSIGLGFEYLFRRAAIERCEDDLSTLNAQDLLLLANEFHPEYLRRCEHIYTNLIVLFWAILKKGSVQGNFDISGATSVLRSKGHQLLLSGYDEKIRNGIAHGRVIFSLANIQYGSNHFPYALQDDEFLYIFDTLCRTSNSLAIAILLFIARNQLLLSAKANILPTSIIWLIVAAETERIGLSLRGVIESEIKSGRQLHILTETIFKKRESILIECSHIALRLLDAGAVGYSRYVFGIHQGTRVDSMVAILPERLSNLANQSYTRFGEILDAELIWTTEGVLMNRIKAFKVALISNFKLGWMKFIREQQIKGIFLTANRYYVKDVKNSSAGGLARVHIFVTLRFASDATNPDMVKRIMLSVIQKFRRKRFATNPSRLLKRWNLYKRPKYVWVSLYQNDGPKRWVLYGGWLRKNLIAVAERIYDSKAEPIFVKKLDEVWRGVRFQYSIDIEAAARSLAEILKLANQAN